MKTVQLRNFFSIVILILVVSSLGACSLKHMSRSDEEALRQRVDSMMQAKIADDWGKVYEFQAPEYKKKVPKDEFLGINRKMSVLRYSIASLEMAPSGKEATVKVKFAASVRGFEFDGMINTQQWINIKGTWYEKADTEKSKPF